MRPTDATTVTPQDKPKRPRWPFIVAGLLVVHVVLMMVAVVIATGDRSFAVLPNYYDNAVHWDQDQAKKRASEKLGWKLEIVPAESVDPLGRRGVTIRLADAKGQPMAAAAVEVSYFHHSHANEPQKLAATTAADGRATVTAPMRHAGFYDFHCTAVAGGQAYAVTLTQYVSTTDPSAATASASNLPNKGTP